VSAQEVAAETQYQGSGAQREPGRNVHAVWLLVPHEVSYAKCRRPVQRPVVVRQSQLGSHPRPGVRNMQAVIGKLRQAVSALHQELLTVRYLPGENMNTIVMLYLAVTDDLGSSFG
jgi:hypothetical protein